MKETVRAVITYGARVLAIRWLVDWAALVGRFKDLARLFPGEPSSSSLIDTAPGAETQEDADLSGVPTIVAHDVLCR